MMNAVEVKRVEELSLLQGVDSNGRTIYTIISHLGTPNETLLETHGVASTAYARLNELAKELSTTPSGLAPSFEELDASLMNGETMDLTLARHLQRGKNKLDLGVPMGFQLLWYEDLNYQSYARMRYGSYPIEARTAALRTLPMSILLNLLDPTVISDIVATQRKLKKKFRELDFDGSYDEFIQSPYSNLMQESAIASIKVVFKDQRGGTHKLPYTIAARGDFNFYESLRKTNMGKKPDGFSTGKTLFEDDTTATSGSNLPGHNADEDYHRLFRFDNRPVRGSVNLTIAVRNQREWNDVLVYSDMATTEYERESPTMKAENKQRLLSQTLVINGLSMDQTITVPIFVEPLPNHLVEVNGRIVAKWSQSTSIDELPHHQKVNLTLEGKMFSQIDEKWVRSDGNTSITIKPSNINDWKSSQTEFSVMTDEYGIANFDIAPGIYAILQTETNEELGIISVPAAYYYRRTDSRDTTPIGVVGAKVHGNNGKKLSEYRLESQVPPLLEGKEPESGSFYKLMREMFVPSAEAGWPGSESTNTSKVIFDTAEVKLQKVEVVDSPSNGTSNSNDSNDSNELIEGGLQILGINESIEVYPTAGDRQTDPVTVTRIALGGPTIELLAEASGQAGDRYTPAVVAEDWDDIRNENDPNITHEFFTWHRDEESILDRQIMVGDGMGGFAPLSQELDSPIETRVQGSAIMSILTGKAVRVGDGYTLEEAQAEAMLVARANGISKPVAGENWDNWTNAGIDSYDYDKRFGINTLPFDLTIDGNSYQAYLPPSVEVDRTSSMTGLGNTRTVEEILSYPPILMENPYESGDWLGG